MHPHYRKGLWQLFEILPKFKSQRVSPSGPIFERDLQQPLIGFVALRPLQDVRAADLFQPVAGWHQQPEREEPCAFNRIINCRLQVNLLLPNSNLVSQQSLNLWLHSGYPGIEDKIRFQKPKGIE